MKQYTTTPKAKDYQARQSRRAMRRKSRAGKGKSWGRNWAGGWFVQPERPATYPSPE